MTIKSWQTSLPRFANSFTQRKIFLTEPVLARNPLPDGNELLEGALVADGQMTAAQFNDACLSPNGELLAHEFARLAEHCSQYLLRQAQGRRALGFFARVAPVDQGDHLLDQSRRYVQERGILDQVGGAPQAGA